MFAIAHRQVGSDPVLRQVFFVFCLLKIGHPPDHHSLRSFELMTNGLRDWFFAELFELVSVIPDSGMYTPLTLSVALH